MPSYQVSLPLPPRKASSNFRGRSVSRGLGAYRDVCAWLFLLATREERLPRRLLTPVVIHLDYYVGRPGPMGAQNRDAYRPRDEHNAIAAAKPAIDALKQAGVIPDDSARYVHAGRVRIHSTQAEHQGRCELVMTLEEPDSEP